MQTHAMYFRLLLKTGLCSHIYLITNCKNDLGLKYVQCVDRSYTESVKLLECYENMVQHSFQKQYWLS